MGEVTVFPGHVSFANEFGIAVIPAFLVEELVAATVMTALRDEFERFLLRQNKYPSGQVHRDWSNAIKNEFKSWIAKYPKRLTITSKDVEAYLEKKVINSLKNHAGFYRSLINKFLSSNYLLKTAIDPERSLVLSWKSLMSDLYL